MKCLCVSSTHLHLSRLVVAAIFVFISRSVAIAEEALKAVLAPQLPHDLVQGLTVEGVVVHSKGRVADGGKQGRVRVLPEAKRSRYTSNKRFDKGRIRNRAVYQNIFKIPVSVNHLGLKVHTFWCNLKGTRIPIGGSLQVLCDSKARKRHCIKTASRP